MAHRHTVRTQSDPLPFVAPVATGARENRAAHGGVRYRQTCRCGACRDELVNGNYREVGPWRVN